MEQGRDAFERIRVKVHSLKKQAMSLNFWENFLLFRGVAEGVVEEERGVFQDFRVRVRCFKKHITWVDFWEDIGLLLGVVVGEKWTNYLKLKRGEV